MVRSPQWCFLWLFVGVMEGVPREPCRELSSCHCILQNGSVVDLTTEGLSDGKARFSMQSFEKDHKQMFYSFNPCFPFTENSNEYLTLEPACENVAGCWYENVSSILLEKKVQTAFGQQDTVSFFWEKENRQLAMNFVTVTTEGHRINELNVILICDKNGTESRIAVRSAKKDTLYLNLHSRCACFDGCNLVVENSNLSVGTILLIVLLSLCLVYILGGVLFNLVIVRATGRDVFPNYAFWSSLPSLIKDGAVYSVSCCCKTTPPYNDL